MKFKAKAVFLAAFLAAACSTSSDAILFSGTGGTPTPPPPTPGLPAALTVYNTSGSTLTNSPVSYEQPFATGDMPTGYHAVMYSGATPLTTQQDDCSSWAQDGSCKSTQLSFVAPTVTGSSSAAYTVQAVAGAPSTTANISTAQATGNTDICVKTSDLQKADGTAETGTWRLACLNDIITNYTQLSLATGYGTNPTGGWEYYSKGPVKIGIHAWQFAKRESDNAIHKWLRTDLWVDMRGSGTTPCPCSVSFITSEPNQFGGVAAGTIGGSTESAYNFSATLYNGANVLYYWGGSNDARTATVANSKFNTTTGVLDLSGTWSDTTGGIFPVKFSCATSCPTGINAGQVYWIGQVYGGTSGYNYLYGAQCDSTTCTDYLTPSGAAANIPIHTTDNTVTVNVINAAPGYTGAYIKLCPTSTCVATTSDTFYALSSVTDISRGSNTYMSALPVGGGNVFIATNYATRFTTQGSGTITMTPMGFTNPYTGMVGLDSNASRVWISAAGTVTPAPTTLIGHDFAYLTQKTKATPPYITALSGNLRPYTDGNFTANYYPGSYFLQWNIDETGDGPGDERVSYINHTGAYSLFNPADANAAKTARAHGAGFGRGNMYNIDERSGLMMVYNKGHAKNDVTYTGMGAVNPTARTYPYLGGGLMTPYASDFDRDALLWQYGTHYDGSHLPMPMQAPLLKSGDPEWLFMAQMEANAVYGGEADMKVISGTTYVRPLGPVQQTRGMAWGTRVISQANYFTRSTDIAALYINDVLKTQGDWLAAASADMDSRGQVLGFYPRDVDNGEVQFQPWQEDFIYLVTGIEAWRAEIPSFQTYITYNSKFTIGRMDTVGGGCLWAGPSRQLYPFIGNVSAWANIALIWDDLYANTAAVQNQGWQPGNGGMNPWTTCPTTGIYFDAGGSTSSNPAGLVTFASMSAAMGAVLGVTRSSSIYTDIRSIQYAGTSYMSGGILSFIDYQYGVGVYKSIPEFAIGPLGATN